MFYDITPFENIKRRNGEKKDQKNLSSYIARIERFAAMKKRRAEVFTDALNSAPVKLWYEPAWSIGRQKLETRKWTMEFA